MENKKLDEFNDYIKYRKIAVIGLGVSNIPLLDYLHEKKAKVTVFDQRTIDNISKDVMDKITSYSFEFSLGENYLEKLKGPRDFNIIDDRYIVVASQEEDFLELYTFDEEKEEIKPTGNTLDIIQPVCVAL